MSQKIEQDATKGRQFLFIFAFCSVLVYAGSAIIGANFSPFEWDSGVRIGAVLGWFVAFIFSAIAAAQD